MWHRVTWSDVTWHHDVLWHCVLTWNCDAMLRYFDWSHVYIASNTLRHIVTWRDVTGHWDVMWRCDTWLSVTLHASRHSHVAVLHEVTVSTDVCSEAGKGSQMLTDYISFGSFQKENEVDLFSKSHWMKFNISYYLRFPKWHEKNISLGKRLLVTLRSQGGFFKLVALLSYTTAAWVLWNAIFYWVRLHSHPTFWHGYHHPKMPIKLAMWAQSC